MRRFLVSSLTVVVATIAVFFGVAYARPEWLPSWARLIKPHEPKAEEAGSAQDLSTALEHDAPDDGWCAHVGKSAAAGCKISLPTIRLTSAKVADIVGLRTSKAESRILSPTVTGNAEITFVTHDYAHITSRVVGRIVEVPTDEGRTVKKGEVLVVVDSAEVGTAKAQYLSIVPVVKLARRDFHRAEQLRVTGAVSEKEELTSQAALTKAEADLLNARQKLLNMGFTDADITRIEATRDTSNFLKIEAPMSGRLVERHAVIGEAVAPPTGAVTSGQMAALFEIADLHELWAWIDVGEADIPRVAIGQKVRFTISGTDKPVFTGTVELISYSVNTATRTVRVRAGLMNIDERLRANQYGRAEIQVGTDRNAVIVPREAVQSEGSEEFVFLPMPDGRRFRTQRVETKPTEQSDRVEIAFGVKSGDVVVTTGSFLLKTELFKSSLGGD